MADNINQLSKAITEAIKESQAKGTKPYDTPAEVKRVEDGTAWVHIPGGIEETPVKMTVNAIPGDVVQVRVADGRAWITGNASAPPTDDRTAIEALDYSKIASEAANSAVNSATAASAAAAEAIQTAESVRGIAERAEEDAAAAHTAATNASEYAARALGNLSTVQSVTETLTWITQHGTMTPTTDAALDPTHVYFVEDENGDYDVGGVKYAVVTEPVIEDISDYYELSIDESLNNYVATHLAVTSEGLWIIPDAGGNKVLIATGQGETYTSAGTYIIGQVDGVDTTLASFLSSRSVIGQSDGQRLELDATGMNGYNEDGARFFSIDYDGGQTTVTNANKIHDYYLSVRLTTEERQITNIQRYRIGVSRLAVGEQVKVPRNFLCSFEVTKSTSVTRYGTPVRTVWVGTEQIREDRTRVDINFNPSETDYITIGTNYTSPEAVREFNVTYDTRSYRITAGVQIRYNNQNEYIEILQRITSRKLDELGTRLDIQIRGFYNGEFSWETITTAPAFALGTRTSDTIGDFSATIGEGLNAENSNQTAIGKYNDNDQANAFEIGNGTDDQNRSNAFSVAWNGDTTAAGEITDGAGNVLSAKADISSIPDVSNFVDKETPEFTLDTSAAAGTTDGDLYAAITALQWESEVIDNA